MTLNQHERAPLPVEDQTVQIYAATNGFLDRLNAERVTEFLVELTERMHSEHGPISEKIAGGDWSDETQKAVQDAVGSFAKDFGYDLDEEGQPLDDDVPERASRPDGEDQSADEGRGQSADEGQDQSAKEPQAA
jgi:F-type H+-transporting ATPase subunit alpha